MPICFFFEFAMERKNVVHQVVLELLHVFLLAFAAHKFFPCAEQILDGDDTLVTMSELDPPNRTPPPTTFACHRAYGDSIQAMAGISRSFPEEIALYACRQNRRPFHPDTRTSLRGKLPE